MYVLSRELRIRVLHALVEGNSVNATARMTGVGKPTILRLLLAVGLGCAMLHDRLVRGVRSALIQADEIWGCIAKKQRRVTPEDPAEWGDAYTFVALDANTRLIVSYLVGKRDAASTRAFIADLRARVAMVPQISTDGFAPYVEAILSSFGGAVDFAQLTKHYARGGRRDDDHRYEPPRDPFITKAVITGVPDPARISTSLVEAQNRTIRMHVRRMTRLCDGFSKKLVSHRAALALHFAFYDFVRTHETIKTAPAVAAGLIESPLSLGELLDQALAEQPSPAPEPQRREPRPGTGAARELPGGKGWLRAVPNAPAERQGDLFDWAQKPPGQPLSPPGTQLSLFGDDEVNGGRGSGLI